MIGLYPVHLHKFPEKMQFFIFVFFLIKICLFLRIIIFFFTLKSNFQIVHRRLRLGAQQGVHGHDDAGRAEAALRAVGLGDALLNGVQFGRCTSNSLGGGHG